MNITITIDNSLKDIIANYLKYQSQIEDKNGKMIDSPETQEDFLIRKGKEYYQNCYEAGRVKEDKLDRDSRLPGLQIEKDKITAI